jgi:hypothetical protein
MSLLLRTGLGNDLPSPGVIELGVAIAFPSVSSLGNLVLTASPTLPA